MNVAIVTDWLTVFGGAEHAVLELHRLWPHAPLYTSVANPERLGPLRNADIRTSKLQWLFRVVKKHQPLLPFLPRAMENIDLAGYDVIVSSSHAVGKGIIPPSTSVHVCYCHTPMRYAWEMEQEYLEDFRIPHVLRSRVRRVLKRLRRWDLSTAKRVDRFIANSTETQRRIFATYGRESVVIPPPVDDRFFTLPLVPMNQRRGWLAVGRLVPYKKFDLLIETANAMHLPLTIVGRGQEEARLKRLAGPTVAFRGFVPDDELPSLYANAQGLLFPQYEDAGIVPLEAQACGLPVVAFGRGGALDSVIDGETGCFFLEQTTNGIRDAVDRASKLTFDPSALRAHAEKFSAAHFREAVTRVVEETLAKRG